MPHKKEHFLISIKSNNINHCGINYLYNPQTSDNLNICFDELIQLEKQFRCHKTTKCKSTKTSKYLEKRTEETDQVRFQDRLIDLASPNYNMLCGNVNNAHITNQEWPTENDYTAVPWPPKHVPPH